ncbi:hypothetical protein [Anaeromyxobacter dehalogenans]|uniref:hypothetical protein n=1 Tax=Anaeromyxobacter dehalogenans TaxID=161493 RepID=UPI00059D78A5|nr:hypothetical protein [Anaeromyxobacter dehalogenans]
MFEQRAREEYVERQLEKNRATKTRAAATDALVGVRGLADMCENIQAPVPAEDLTQLAPAIQRVLDLVEAADAPVVETVAFLSAANGLSTDSTGSRVPPSAFHRLAHAARQLEEPLAGVLANAESLVEAERVRLEQEAILEDEDKARLIERHRARILREEERLLALLKQFRELSVRPEDDSGSFVRLEVRLVGKR